MTQPTKPRKPGYYQARETWTRAYILKALVDCRGNQSKAAKQLGMSRRTLLYQCEALNIPRPGPGVGRTEPSIAHQRAIKDAFASATAPLQDLFGDYVAMFAPAPTPDKPLGYAAGVEDGRAAERKERDHLGDAIAARAKDLEAKATKQAAEIAKLKQELDAEHAAQEVDANAHAAAAQAQRACDAEAQVRDLMAANAELKLRHGRNRSKLQMLEGYRDREPLVREALHLLESYAIRESGSAKAAEVGGCKLVAQIRAWSFDPSPGVIEISGADGGALEVTEHASAAEFLAKHPPSNRCPVPPEDHTCVSTCCDGAPLFLRPVRGVSAEEVQTMHDERIKEAFAKLGPPAAPAVVEPVPPVWGAGLDGEDPFDPKEYLS